MSSPPTIGLLGHNGLVGSHLLKELVTLHQNGTIKLVVIHRAGSKTDTVPAEIERRELDIASPDGPAYDAAVKGLKVIVSTVGGPGLKDQINLIPALTRSKDFVTFLPSEYGIAWTDVEAKEINFPALGLKNVIHAEFKKANLATTIVNTGAFTTYAFQYPILGSDVKGNKIYVYRDSQKTPGSYTTDPYTGKGIAEVLKKPLDSIVNKQFDVVEFEATGQDITDVLTKIHGAPTELTHFDDAKVAATKADANPFVALGGGLLGRSGGKGFGGQGERVKVPGWQGQDLETILRGFTA